MTGTAATHRGDSETPRDVARRLAGQCLSNREIGRRVGVSETTVRRWRRADAERDTLTLTLDADADLRDDLAVLAEAGLAADTAVVLAVQLLADSYRSAWDYGDVPRGTRPRVRTITTP